MSLGFPLFVVFQLKAHRDLFWVCETSATRKFAFLFADFRPKSGPPPVVCAHCTKCLMVGVIIGKPSTWLGSLVSCRVPYA